MSRLKGAFRRPAQVAGLAPLVGLRRHLEEIEEAFAENARHERLLVLELARIEASVGRIAAAWQQHREEDHPES